MSMKVLRFCSGTSDRWLVEGARTRSGKIFMQLIINFLGVHEPELVAAGWSYRRSSRLEPTKF